MKLSMLPLVALVMSLSSVGHASVKACGKVSRSIGTMVFTQEIDGSEPRVSPMYSNNQEVQAQLATLSVYRQVCLLVSTNAANEADTVVLKILSKQM